ncbi:HAD-IIA family hydrolase [Spiractinospora alimapuensis]|uniref:HAD-IIA family hydrolase n=1 Tax=Spiractinospora alimapuensis TaxID=2820884 RepID=UPI001F39B169|nr:HAD-IIA family hydrolase [Spiractinospora alimapuensis]QVQ54084.1 HAD-IIA family hydrolase [Spiractinospora alimapuensis]
MGGLVVDLDGTVYLGESLIPGVDEALGRLRAAGFGVVFATNKSVARPKDYVDKLTHLGVRATEDDLVTVNAVLADHLAERLSPTDRVLAVGEAPLFEALAAAGLHTTTDWSEAAAVAMGWDRSFDYATLDAVFQAARRGAYVAATNPDVTCPVEHGEVPDCGMQIAALEAGLGRPIDIVVGKPAATMARAATSRLGLPPEHCWMIGDRVSTDMRMAHEAGMRSALVLTGVTTRDQAVESRWEPDLVCESLVEFADRFA